MERAKEELKKRYNHYLEEGFSREEALLKAVKEVKEGYPEGVFTGALEDFLSEILSSYRLENLPEADPFLSFIESLFEEFNLLKPKLSQLLSKLRELRDGSA